jgi:hypothetical protein
MGFFAKWKASNAYDDSLKSYGVNPFTLPVDLNAAVCSYTNQAYEHSFVAQVVPLDHEMGRAGALVALCVLGPNNYSARLSRHDVSMNETVREAARVWRESGPESSLDTMIIQAVSNAGVLHGDFVTAFNAML